MMTNEELESLVKDGTIVRYEFLGAAGYPTPSDPHWRIFVSSKKWGPRDLADTLTRRIQTLLRSTMFSFYDSTTGQKIEL